MLDTKICPICQSILKNKKLPKYHVTLINKTADYWLRICPSAINHSLQLLSETNSKQIHLIKFSICHKYSKFVELDILNQKSKISLLNHNQSKFIILDKLLIPDFPQLIKLKEKVQTLITFL